MLLSRKLNTRINKLHERALRIVYKDNGSSFEDLLMKDNSVTIHERNIQTLGIELYKVVNRISPKIMFLILHLNSNSIYPGENDFKTRNVKTVGYGTETIAHLAPKIWSLIPVEIKKSKSLFLFSKEIRKWKPSNCPCRLCKTYIKGLGFVKIAN